MNRPATPSAAEATASPKSEIRSVRVAAIGDLHCTKTSEGAFQPLFARIAESADVLVLAWSLALVGAVGGTLVVAGVDRLLRWIAKE